VDEPATVRQGADWFSALADDSFKVYAADTDADRETLAKLKAARDHARRDREEGGGSRKAPS
jgi:hypothetical protein